ncbi:hypothetical protein I6N95_24940 [Vagococcus sp. BWB3-3]|uniref:LPXTG cell wall anchor domain-containing protein n=1 Tax=Vagococcus allomyrinae TaxID=2794353 RepID=A0A940PG60_9ENTE|nr:hypothetical protein [Vagococcus allomyrinae]MBP1044259.1 hypothetical protein [Vagococcus allomyrinae]
MKVYKKIMILICFLTGCLMIVAVGGITHGAEGIGGQVSTGGNITFYEESTEPTDSSTSSSGTQPSQTPPSGDPKKIVKIPSLGVLLNQYGIYGMMILFLIGVFYVSRRRRKDKGNQ